MDPGEKTMIHTIAVHARLDQDEAIALFLARQFGELVMPGISTAAIKFWAKTPEPLTGISVDRLEERGLLLIGTGHGRLDEHLTGGGRKHGECAATLVAKAVGCDQDPIVARLMALALHHDTNLVGTPMGFALLIKTMAASWGDEKAFAWAEKILKAVFKAGPSFFEMRGDLELRAAKRWAELVSIWFLVRFAEKECPEAATDASDYVVLGIPDDVFVRLGIVERDRERPAMQIARAFDLDEDISLGKLLDFTDRRHGKAGGDVFELHSLTNLLFAAGLPVAEIWDWVLVVLDALWKQGLSFAETAATDFANAAVKNIFIQNGDGRLRSAKMVVGESECESFAKYARSEKHGCSAAVVVQKRLSSGNIVILPDQNRRKIDLTDVVAMLRVAEIRAANRQGDGPARQIPLDPKVLRSLGTIPECPEWHLFGQEENGGPRRTMGLFNGSLTHSAPPTNLTLDQVSNLVQIGVNPQRFEPRRAVNCESGHCTSSNQSICPWDIWKLERCQRVRGEL